MNTINIFVPGRISIIGELSDLVTEYKSTNNTIIPGEVIAGGIDKGIYATAKISKDFIFKFDQRKFIAKNMDLETLYETAKKGNFFSYIAAVAYYMKSNFDVSGISINVKYMNLPIQKGLSSSASICVLVTKAFNKLYNLQLEDNEIMEIAYKSERFALSMCGRLDQICAKGLCLSHIIFNEENLNINNIEINKELNFVIADLNGFKDTKKILSSIHNCFPFPKNKDEELVKQTLCEKNHYLVNEAINAIKNGNLQYLGELLNEAQKNIDSYIGKICKEIYGTILHKVMSDTTIKKYSYGSKGTGSNGDGSIIILAKNKISQKNIIKYLEKEYKFKPFEYNVKKTYSIKKAIIDINKTEFDLHKLISILQTLDDAEIKRIMIIGKSKYLHQIKSTINKKYSTKVFNSLSDTEKIHQINLYRIYEKLILADSNEMTEESLKDYCKNSAMIYISRYNTESDDSVKNILNKYEQTKEYKTVNNTSSFDKMSQNTIFKFQK